MLATQHQSSLLYEWTIIVNPIHRQLWDMQFFLTILLNIF